MIGTPSAADFATITYVTYECLFSASSRRHEKTRRSRHRGSEGRSRRLMATIGGSMRRYALIADILGAAGIVAGGLPSRRRRHADFALRAKTIAAFEEPARRPRMPCSNSRPEAAGRAIGADSRRPRTRRPART